MPVASDRLEFAPPQQPGMLRAFGLAIVAHLLLLAALTWGINWKHDTENLAAEAELWSATPQQAAPRPVEVAPPPPAPQPAPAPRVEPPPQPVQRDADIALEREKKKRAEAKEREEELAQKKKLEAQKKLAEQKKQDELQKKQELAKKAEERKKADAAKQAQTAKQQQEDAKRLEAQRQDNLRRIQGMAGATGSEDAKGSAARSSGPSDSYGGRIRARVRPNIVFSDDVAGNPTAEVEVRMAPDGTITSRRIVKSSGARAWDEAVLRALDKTEVLPRDVDGRVHSPLLIAFKFRD